MPDLKVKDIADELNTKSKKIIEKLDELNILGKGPMSRLSEDEIQKLYEYIGFIRPKKEEEVEKAPEEQKKEPVVRPAAAAEKPSHTQHKGQYIMKRTQNVIDNRGRDNNLKKDPRKRYIVSSDDSGLLQGYTTTKTKFKRPSVAKTEEKQKDIPAAVTKEEEIEKEKVQEMTPVKKIEEQAVPEKVTEEAVKERKAEEAAETAVEQKEETKVRKQAGEKTHRTEPPKIEKREAEKRQPVKTDKMRKPAAEAGSVKQPAAVKRERPYEKAAAGSRPVTRKPVTGAANKEFGKEASDGRGQKIIKKQPTTEAPFEFKETAKPEKAQDKKPGKKIEQQKQAKKEIGTTDGSRTKRQAKTSEEVIDMDLKTTARMFSEEQVAEAGLADEKVLDFYSKAAPRYRQRTKKNRKRMAYQQELQKPAIPSVIKIDETITVKELAEMIKKTASAVISKLMNLGIMASANEVIDFDTAALVADEYDIKTVLKEIRTEEDILFDDTEEEDGDMQTRPPIVVVMGHVDHGKTSLLDAIKNTNVIDTEKGGITQHIGAYMVNVGGRDITFLDTPGHEAFTSLRARGAQVTDIAILVVAADDGIMPQTVEAINHAKAANVSIIVAINKIDKPDANVERVKQQLTEYGLVAEEWGGDTVCVPVSAKLNQNIDDLLDMVILTADMLDLKSDPNKQAKGTVIDASLDKNRGVLTTVIVQRGTLKLGDSLVTGTTVGKIRAMNDYKGIPIKSATPSTPVEIIGLPEIPEAGELFYAIEDQKLARQLAEKRKTKIHEEHIKKQNVVSLEDLFSRIKEGEVKDLNLIIKADVQGSIEALKQSLTKLSNEEVSVKILHDAVGTITETDVLLAQVSGATIIGFNVRPSASVTETAEAAGIDIRLYGIIYEVIDDIEKAMKGMLAPKYKEELLGHAEIRETFKISGIGTIAGCYVTDGKILRNARIRLLRNGIIIYTGDLASLKRFKDDAREVSSGYECGTSIEKFNDIKIGDIIEAYHIIEEVRD